MVLEIRSIVIKVTIDTNKYTHVKEVKLKDLDADIESIKEYIEDHLAQQGW